MFRLILKWFRTMVYFLLFNDVPTRMIKSIWKPKTVYVWMSLETPNNAGSISKKFNSI